MGSDGKDGLLGLKGNRMEMVIGRIGRMDR